MHKTAKNKELFLSINDEVKKKLENKREDTSDAMFLFISEPIKEFKLNLPNPFSKLHMIRNCCAQHNNINMIRQ